jgi:hypothetical protein
MTTAIQKYNPNYARVMFVIEKAGKILEVLEFINRCTKRLKRVDSYQCKKKKKKAQQFRLSFLLGFLIAGAWSEINIIRTQPLQPMPVFAKGGIIFKA